MTASLNKTMLMGFLGEDPVRRETQGGAAVVTLSLGTTERWKDRATGERRSATEWHSVVIFNEALGKTAMSYLRKGSGVYVEGQLRYRRYTDRNNVERKVSEVTLPKYGGDLKLMDRRQDEAASREESGRERAAGDDSRPRIDPEDEIPF
ncbi:MAG: single-stranded DNA-binding protein [Sphingobium sp.]